MLRRQDTEEYTELTARSLTGTIISSVVISISIFLPDEARLLVWAGFGVGWLIGPVLMAAGLQSGDAFGVRPTDWMVERFGLFTIIVPGEVVVGVVDGLSGVARDLPTVATGMIGSTIEFGIWWTYFDFVGRRLPGDTPTRLLLWMYSHLPVAMGIAASGADMVSLVVHAADERVPAPTAWLLTGSVAVVLVVLMATMRSLQDFERMPGIYRPVSIALLVGAIGVLLAGWARPIPWMLVLLVAVVVSVVWGFAVNRWLRHRMTDDSLGHSS